MNERFDHRRSVSGWLNRRDLVIGASALGASAAVGMAASPARAQDATPEARPVTVATPMASPVAAGGPGFFDTDEHRMVMTFNVGHAGDEELWEARKEVVLEVLQQNRPLLVGMQEPLHIQLEYFLENLEGYDYIGVSRQGNTEDEYNPILFDTSRVTVEEQSTFWLSETPSEPGSMMPGVGHPRIATWGRFAIQGHPNPIYMVNTHLSFEEGVVDRQVEVLLEGLQPIFGSGAEVILTADFNRPRMTHLWKMFQDAGFQDAWQLATHTDGPPTTFHGWEGLDARGGFEQGLVADTAEYQIDWILYRPGSATSGSRPLLVQVDTHHQGDQYPSDHFPVALMTLGNPAIATADLQVTPAEVLADDEIEVMATATNSGETGVAEVSLYVDREVTETRWVKVQGGESREVSFPLRLYAPGEHEVSIDLLPAEVVTVEGVPPTLAFVAVEAEPYIEPGQVIPITAEIENRGSYEGSLDVELYVDGALVETTEVSIPAGGVREVGFVHGFEESGAYTVTVGSESLDVSVMEPLPEEWRFSRGDDDTWSDPEFDDSDWQSVVLPESWESHDDYTEDFVYGWYRQTVTVPAEWEGRPVRLIVGQIDDAEKTFFNGELVGETGRFPDDEGGFLSEWNVIREYDIAPELVNYGAENVIAVRIYDDLGGGGIHRGPLGMLPLAEDALDEA
jgi:endonuclease/exonuclease/phosphatase family metal-dependent hydrolase